MKFHTEIRKGAAVVKPRARRMVMGDGDIGLRHVLKELTDAGIRTIYLDLSKVRDVDGACLQEILVWGRRLKSLGGELALMSPALSDVSSLVTLLQDMRSFADLDDALGASERPSRLKVVADGALKVLDDVLGKTIALKVPAA